MQVRTIKYQGEIYARLDQLTGVLNEAKIGWLEELTDTKDTIKQSLIKSKISTLDAMLDCFDQVKWED